MGVIEDFIHQMRAAGDCDAAKEAVDQLFAAPSPDEIVSRLIAVSNQIENDEMLGWYIFPGLRRKVTQDPSLFPGIKALVRSRDIRTNVRLHAIDLIDKLYRDQHTRYPADYISFICDTAVDRQVEIPARARIARLLSRVPGRKQLDTLRNLVHTEDMELVEAAAHTVSRWPGDRLRRHAEIVTEIIRIADRSPAEAIRQPSLLLTIARSRNRKSGDVIDRLIDSTQKEDDWQRLAACIGPHCNRRQLARIVEGVADTMGSRAMIPLRHLFKKEPARLESLYTSGYHSAFVKAIEVDPYRIGAKALGFLEDLEKKQDPDMARSAKRLRQELTSARRNPFLPSARLLEWQEKGDNPGPHSTDAQVIHDPYCTGFHMGDALYRNTFVWDPTCHNHWHGAIFQTFTFDSKNAPGHGSMQGIHITGFPFAKVQTFTANRSFAHPTCKVADAMKGLRDGFLAAFKADGQDAFHGARTTDSPIAPGKRLEILNASADLVEQGIDYTWWDMLTSKSDHWQGTVSDIDRIRCDGVVEYTYERCGKQVCVGTRAAHWNIANAGNEYLESHADLHTWTHGLTAGELCPRVQAGDAGTGSSFVKPSPSGPQVEKFAVTRAGGAVAVKFKVASKEYHTVYVRITVHREDHPYGFIVTRQNGNPEAIPGEWMFMEVDAGTNHFAYWKGDTMAGHYGGITGRNVFQIVAVDRGGNVSAELSCELTVT
jgi:hypothetical protein